MHDYRRPDVTEWHYGNLKISQRIDQPTFDVFSFHYIDLWSRVGTFDTFAAAQQYIEDRGTKNDSN